jgi:hypothetical protein
MCTAARKKERQGRWGTQNTQGHRLHLRRSCLQLRRQSLTDRMCFFRPYEHVRSVSHHMNKKVEASFPFFSFTISLTLSLHFEAGGVGGGGRRASPQRNSCVEVKSAFDAYLLTGIATAGLMKTIHYSRRRHLRSSEKCILLSS